MVNTGKRTVFNILVLFYILLVKTQMLINIRGLMIQKKFLLLFVQKDGGMGVSPINNIPT